MKLKVLFFTALLSVLSLSISAKGRIPILYGAGETVTKVLDLPTTEEFQIQTEDGMWHHANLGILHDQFSLFYIPLYNYGIEKYVLYTDEKVGEYDYTYADLSREEIRYIQDEVEEIPLKPELPFWDVWGGKILAWVIFQVLYLIKEYIKDI